MILAMLYSSGDFVLIKVGLFRKAKFQHSKISNKNSEISSPFVKFDDESRSRKQHVRAGYVIRLLKFSV